MTDTILFVDDEVAVLNIYGRMLASLTTIAAGADVPSVAIQTATSGMEGEFYLLQQPQCAIVVSDLRMPGMDGLTFLERARVISPDAVRILVTGNADVTSAIQAINRTSIFRLLTKPFSELALGTAVGDALKQYHLVIAERQLLEQTLRGSVQVLVEILTLVDPLGSSRALRIHRYVGHIIRTLSLQDAWALEVAAMLSHLGSLTQAAADRPPAVAGPDTNLEGPASGYQAHPSMGAELLKHIPRLDAVADIIARQQDAVDRADAKVPLTEREPSKRGGHVLRVAIEFDAAIVGGMGRREALDLMPQRPDDFDRAVVDALSEVELPERKFEARTEAMADLRVGMILDEDLLSPYGLLIMPRGQEITPPVLMRLKSSGSHDLRKRLRVLAPRA